MSKLTTLILCAASLLLLTGATFQGGTSFKTTRLATRPYDLCSELPAEVPGNTITQVNATQDLHAVVTANCATGCTLELAPGVYDDTSVTIGPVSLDRGIKVGSLDETTTGTILVRAADPDDKPVLRAGIGQQIAIFTIWNTGIFLRLEDIIMDGRRSEQTNDVFTEVCIDTTPADDICDTLDPADEDANLTKSTAGAVFTASTNLTDVPRVCALRVEARETVYNSFQIRGSFNSTVEDSLITGSGCDTTTCPLIDIPGEQAINARTHAGRGINFSKGSRLAAVGNVLSDHSKMAIQCFDGATQCYAIGNKTNGAGSTSIAYPRSSGTVRGNKVISSGQMYPFNTTNDNTGFGISVASDLPGDLVQASVLHNRVEDIWGSGIRVAAGGDAGVSNSDVLIFGNYVDLSCNGDNTAEIGALAGGSRNAVKRIRSIRSIRNTVTNSLCPVGMFSRNVLDYFSRLDSISANSGLAFKASNIETRLRVLDPSFNRDVEVAADVVSGQLSDCNLPGGAAVTVAAGSGVTQSNCGEVVVAALEADAGADVSGDTNEAIQLDGSATGGDFPGSRTWKWTNDCAVAVATYTPDANAQSPTVTQDAEEACTHTLTVCDEGEAACQ